MIFIPQERCLLCHKYLFQCECKSEQEQDNEEEDLYDAVRRYRKEHPEPKPQPIYNATEIRRMCLELPMDHATFSLLVEVIEEDLDLYSEDELVVLFQASTIMFSRSILQMSLKQMR